MHSVRMCIDAQIVEFKQPDQCVNSRYWEVAPSVYFTCVYESAYDDIMDFNIVDILYADGECYYCDTTFTPHIRSVYIEQSHIDGIMVTSTVECRTGKTIYRLQMNRKYKYASAVGLPGDRIAVVYAADEQQPHQYTLEIVDDKSVSTGPIAIITAQLGTKIFPYGDAASHVSIVIDLSADHSSVYITLDDTVYQIRL